MVKPSNPESPRTISVALLLIVLLNDIHPHTQAQKRNILKQKYKHNGHDYERQVPNLSLMAVFFHDVYYYLT